MTATSNDNIAELVKVLAGALSADRIPVPGPSIFSGDPLKYNNWKLSFETLIDQKNIQDKERPQMTNSNESAAISCIFCKKTRHTLHKCRKFMEKMMSERIKFVQAEKLCFGCLKSGHYPKSSLCLGGSHTEVYSLVFFLTNIELIIDSVVG